MEILKHLFCAFPQQMMVIVLAWLVLVLCHCCCCFFLISIFVSISRHPMFQDMTTTQSESLIEMDDIL